jgi:hypothetical protein
MPTQLTAGHGFAQPEAGVNSDHCDDIENGGPVEGNTCVTETIECGQTIIGHTIGGVNRFDSRFYEAQFCTPRLTNHDGGDERVYLLKVPEGDYTAVATLDTPCADLDLAAMRYNGDDCPTKSHNINQCEMWPKDGTAREQVRMVSKHEGIWYIVVEGKNDQEGVFSLTVMCRRGLM